jgi:hypothetical protein
MKPEDLLVERVLVAYYPGENLEARDCAKKLAGVMLEGGIEVDWSEVRRVAKLPEYSNFDECVKLLGEVANELGKQSPLRADPD